MKIALKILNIKFTFSIEKLNTQMEEYSEAINKDPSNVSIGVVKTWIESYEKASQKSRNLSFGIKSIPANVQLAMITYSDPKELLHAFPEIKTKSEKDYSDNVIKERLLHKEVDLSDTFIGNLLSSSEENESPQITEENKSPQESVHEGLRTDFERSLKGFHFFYKAPEAESTELSLSSIDPSWHTLNDAISKYESAADNLVGFTEDSNKKDISNQLKAIFKSDNSNPSISKLIHSKDSEYLSETDNRNLILKSLISQMEITTPAMEKLLGKDSISYQEKLLSIREKIEKLKSLTSPKDSTSTNDIQPEEPTILTEKPINKIQQDNSFTQKKEEIKSVLTKPGFSPGKTIGPHEELAYEILTKLDNIDRKEKIAILQAIRLTGLSSPQLFINQEKQSMMMLNSSYDSKIEIIEDKKNNITVKQTYVVNIRTISDFQNNGWVNLKNTELFECTLLFDVNSHLLTYSLSPLKESRFASEKALTNEELLSE